MKLLAGPLPNIEGLPTPPAVASQAARQPAPISTLSSPLPPLSPADRAKFLAVYNNANPVNGLVSGKPTNSHAVCSLIQPALFSRRFRKKYFREVQTT